MFGEKINKVILILLIISIVIICVLGYFLYDFGRKNSELNNNLINMRNDIKDLKEKNEINEKTLKSYIVKDNIIQDAWIGAAGLQEIELVFHSDYTFEETEFEYEKTGETIENYSDGGILAPVVRPIKKFERNGKYSISENEISLNYEIEKVYSKNLEEEEFELKEEHQDFEEGYVKHVINGKELEYKFNGEIINLRKKNEDYSTDVHTDKPIIYLYPQETTRITVKLGNPDKVTCSYPQYNGNGWDVIANPDGNLVDNKTGKNLYSLYWEGKGSAKINMSEGFIVKGKDVAKFLEEKLQILGLTEREMEEFIIYWLPKMENNKYNYIRFATLEEINEYMPLEFSKKPDTLIRVLMQFKKIEEPIEVKEQKLTPIIREGFIAVEWGGTEIN